MVAKKTWREERDEKLRSYIEKTQEKVGLTTAYFKAMQKFGLSYPTVIKIYKSK